VKIRPTLLLLGVFIALGIFIVFVELPSRKKELVTKLGEKNIFVFDENNVREVFIRNPGGEYLIVRGPQEKWRIVKPVETEADQDFVNSLINGMRNLTLERVLEEKPKDLSLYGLDKPRMGIRITLEGSEKPLALNVGKKSPLGRLYAKRDDQERVFLVAMMVEQALMKGLFDLRDKSVVSFERDQVEKIILQTPNKRAELAKRDKGWFVLGRAPVRANENSANKILTALSSLRVEEFIEDHPENLSKYGLDPPWGRVGIILAKDKSQLELRMGSLAPKRLAIYATATGRDSVFLLTSQYRDGLQNIFSELREMMAFAIKGWEVEKFKMAYGENVIEVSKDSSSYWHIAQAFDLKAGYNAANEVVQKLMELKFSRIEDEAPANLSSYGLAKPSASVKIWAQGNKTPEGVIFGMKGKLLFAKRDGEEPVYIVPDSILQTLKKGVNDLLAPEEKPFYEEKLKGKKGTGGMGGK